MRVAIRFCLVLCLCIALVGCAGGVEDVSSSVDDVDSTADVLDGIVDSDAANTSTTEDGNTSANASSTKTSSTKTAQTTKAPTSKGTTTTTTRKVTTTTARSETTTTQSIQMLTASQQLAGLFDGTVTEIAMSGSVGSGFAMHFPDMVWIGDTIYAYYISYPAGYSDRPCIGVATSKDGENFTKVTDSAILAGPEDYDVRMASFAGAWVEDGTVYVVYESTPSNGHANIALATSTDGIHFEKRGVVLRMDSSLRWQNINIGTPDLIKKDGIWYLTFHGYGTDGYDCQIGLAYGEELALGKLTVLPQPILPTSKNPTDHNSGTTGRRDVIYDEESGYFYMVYEVSTDRVGGDFSGSRWNHAFARSKDMMTWESVGPFLERYTSGFGYDGPNLLVKDNAVYVYMRNTSNHTTMLWLMDKSFALD